MFIGLADDPFFRRVLESPILFFSAIVLDVVELYDDDVTVTSSTGTSSALFQLGCFAVQLGSLFIPFTLLLYMRVTRFDILLYE